ncbi:MAG: deoxyribodipyrimidine photo-lyase [Paracoccaceae bacterium]
MPEAPVILWFRRDLRLDDLPMLAAVDGPAIPVFVLDPEAEVLGAAPKFRLDLALAAFAARLEAAGSRLILRRGHAEQVLRDLARETGARGARWTRLYDPVSRARDTGVKASLRAAGLLAESHPGHLLHEPWTVTTGSGGPYRVFTPFWKAVRALPVPPPRTAPPLPAPAHWPASDRLADWHLAAAMDRGAGIVGRWQSPGEPAALDRLADFLAGPVQDYADRRDLLAEEATSGLSEPLTWGEIGPRRIWHAGRAAMEAGARGAEAFLRELVWREFAWHLLYHFPDLARRNWRETWQDFPWRPDNADAESWRRGQTGEPLVDAAMRQMFVTGRMHNRARMVVASYLTKHLLTDWRVGAAWFSDCLTDWDPASNAMGWQWVAGCGPDSAPFFRIFNPETQAAKFDAGGLYRRYWLDPSGQGARDWFDAVPRRWRLSPDAPRPAPLIPLAAGRARALAAYQQAG